MIGSLARTDAYQIPEIVGGDADPRESLPLWARQAEAMPTSPTEPQVGMWPPVQYREMQEVIPDVGKPAIPSGPSWPGTAVGNRIGDLASSAGYGLAKSAVSTDPVSLSTMRPGGILAKTGAALLGETINPDDAEARWIKHSFNRIGVGDTIANLAKQNRLVPTKDIYETTIQPHDIPVGSWLTPLVGDRSRSGALLTHVGEQELRDPVWMQGGYQFTPEWAQQKIAWGSDRSPSSAIAGRIRGLQKEGGDVFGVYTPMTPFSVDASHHMSDTLSQLMHLEKKNISSTAVEQFNARMAFDPDFPGVTSPKLQQYLRNQSMSYRDYFAKTMNSRAARDAGFPDVEQARIAVTHPSLLDVPSYAGGQSIARMTGDVVHGSTGFGLAPHYTYRSKLPGEYVGGLPGPLPQELLWRDLYPKIAARDPSAAGKIWLTMLKGEKPGQLVDRQWHDTAAEYFRNNP